MAAGDSQPSGFLLLLVSTTGVYYSPGFHTLKMTVATLREFLLLTACYSNIIHLEPED